TLDPDGLAPRIANLAEWRDRLLARLRHEYDATGDRRLRDLVEEFAVPGDQPHEQTPAALVVPLRLRAGAAELSFLSTTTVFGTPREVTLSELAIEAFYPADDATRRALTGR
ncbi:MAG: transcriptional regulator, partial [Nocardioides sp.]